MFSHKSIALFTSKSAISFNLLPSCPLILTYLTFISLSNSINSCHNSLFLTRSF
nr:hypothetical protein CoNPh37_CDS0162 [Staphylococcus phage S-CoN_Ph37]